MSDIAYTAAVSLTLALIVTRVYQILPVFSLRGYVPSVVIKDSIVEAKAEAKAKDFIAEAKDLTAEAKEGQGRGICPRGSSRPRTCPR